eukprot:Skav234474  [mRNA]  locus=scaffold1647:295371:296486:- [translate_table: standard]
MRQGVIHRTVPASDYQQLRETRMDIQQASQQLGNQSQRVDRCKHHHNHEVHLQKLQLINGVERTQQPLI